MRHILVMLLCPVIWANTSSENSLVQTLKATWEFQMVRRIIDTQITMATLEAETLIGCSFVCSSLMDVEGLSLYFVQKTKTCYCNMAVDTSPENDSLPEIHYGTLRRFYKKDKNSDPSSRYTEWPYKTDCLNWYEATYDEDGVYRIDPIGGAPTDTWCDMTNGGWTVIQRRRDGSENFYRGWSDYVNGFGNRTGEYWLGLENIHRLTENGSHLEIFLEAFPGVTPSSLIANYTSFIVGDRASKYKLQVAGFTGDSCGDSFVYCNGSFFSTYDYDNDVYNGSCAVEFRGAWWYINCHLANLNGYYFQPGEYSSTNTRAQGLHWHSCWSFETSENFGDENKSSLDQLDLLSGPNTRSVCF